MQIKKSYVILGAICGDIIGSIYETNNVKRTDFQLFNDYSDYTDGTVLTIAVADSIIHQHDFSISLKDFGRRYTYRGYDYMYLNWLNSEDSVAYNSFGNSSAKRVSAIGCAFDTIEKVMEAAIKSTLVTQNHPEGIKGAQAVASTIFMAWNGSNKEEIKKYLNRKFHYKLNFKIDEIRDRYHFSETCQEIVPIALIAFLESLNYESAIRLAISVGGNSGALACITGGIAAAYYKYIPTDIFSQALEIIPEEFIEILRKYDAKFAQ